MTEPSPTGQLPAPRPAIRRRASVFHQAQRAAAIRRRALQLGAIGLVAAMVIAAFAGAAAAATSLPNADGLVSQPLPSDTLVYDRTGKVLLADLHPSGYQHYQVSLAGMGRYLPEATVAIEDSNFWNEPGVDPISIARAGLTDVQARSAVQGGSTITQQLVKRRLVGDDRSVSRKVREAALAVRISRDFSRQQILAMYLNAIAYGNTAYGAEAAARIYFHVDAAQLDLAQAALLAGLPQNPTLLNPLTNWAGARQRQQQVLGAMVRTHAISQQEADRAYAEDLSPPGHLFGPANTNLAPGFIGYVANELAQRFGQDAVQRGGLSVVSSLDWNLQQLAQKTVTGAVAADGWRDVTDGALVSLDPRSGQVLALVGSAGPNVPGGQYDMAVGPPRNPGSSFKVFTYTAAIDSRHYTMVTPIPDTSLTVQMPGSPAYTPRNYDLRSHGQCLLQACLGNSLNVPAVEVELGTGIPAVVTEARNLGAPPFQAHDGHYTSNDSPGSFGPSLTLGGYGETPLQMATGVSVLASGGTLHDPRAILSVTSSSGQALYRPDTSGKQVLDAGAAYIVSQMLSSAANRQLIFGSDTPLTLPGRQAAAKTGTTDDFTDAWTVGYTPSLATAVWMGNANFHPMASGSDGMFVAAPAWHDFMTGALDQLQKGNEWYQMPADVSTQWAGGQQAYFLPGTSPSTPAPSLPRWAHVGWGGAYGDNGGGSGGTNGSGASAGGAGCRSWTYQGGSYWSCTPGPSGLPGDPAG